MGGGSYGGMEEWRSVSGGTLQQLLFASCGTELLDPCAPSLSYIPSQNSTTWIVLNVEDFMPRSILPMGMYMQHHALQ